MMRKRLKRHLKIIQNLVLKLPKLNLINQPKTSLQLSYKLPFKLQKLKLRF